MKEYQRSEIYGHIRSLSSFFPPTRNTARKKLQEILENCDFETFVYILQATATPDPEVKQNIIDSFKSSLHSEKSLVNALYGLGNLEQHPALEELIAGVLQQTYPHLKASEVLAVLRKARGVKKALAQQGEVPREVHLKIREGLDLIMNRDPDGAIVAFRDAINAMEEIQFFSETGYDFLPTGFFFYPLGIYGLKADFTASVPAWYNHDLQRPTAPGHSIPVPAKVTEPSERSGENITDRADSLAIVSPGNRFNLKSIMQCKVDGKDAFAIGMDDGIALIQTNGHVLWKLPFRTPYCRMDVGYIGKRLYIGLATDRGLTILNEKGQLVWEYGVDGGADDISFRESFNEVMVGFACRGRDEYGLVSGGRLLWKFTGGGSEIGLKRRFSKNCSVAGVPCLLVNPGTDLLTVSGSRTILWRFVLRSPMEYISLWKVSGGELIVVAGENGEVFTLTLDGKQASGDIFRKTIRQVRALQATGKGVLGILDDEGRIILYDSISKNSLKPCGIISTFSSAVDFAEIEAGIVAVAIREAAVLFYRRTDAITYCKEGIKHLLNYIEAAKEDSRLLSNLELSGEFRRFVEQKSEEFELLFKEAKVSRSNKAMMAIKEFQKELNKIILAWYNFSFLNRYLKLFVKDLEISEADSTDEILNVFQKCCESLSAARMEEVASYCSALWDLIRKTKKEFTPGYDKQIALSAPRTEAVSAYTPASTPSSSASLPGVDTGSRALPVSPGARKGELSEDNAHSHREAKYDEETREREKISELKTPLLSGVLFFPALSNTDIPQRSKAEGQHAAEEHHPTGSVKGGIKDLKGQKESIKDSQMMTLPIEVRGEVNENDAETTGKGIGEKPLEKKAPVIKETPAIEKKQEMPVIQAEKKDMSRKDTSVAPPASVYSSVPAAAPPSSPPLPPLSTKAETQPVKAETSESMVSTGRSSTGAIYNASTTLSAVVPSERTEAKSPRPEKQEPVASVVLSSSTQYGLTTLSAKVVVDNGSKPIKKVYVVMKHNQNIVYSRNDSYLTCLNSRIELGELSPEEKKEFTVFFTVMGMDKTIDNNSVKFSLLYTESAGTQKEIEFIQEFRQ
ncbi:MAG: hypothetical protein QW728_00845 [Thermoplasmata archaeon]